MDKFKFDCKLKRQLVNVYKMFKYGYLEDFSIKGENIKYGDNNRQYYKVYKGIGKNNITIFFIHGGGWWQGSPSLYSGVGKFFAKKGYTTVLIGYRLVPKFTYPCQIDDCFKALKHYINNNKNENIVIGGYSAGAELACHLAFNLERQCINKINIDLIKGFFSIAGVLDFTKCYSEASKRLIKNYINGKSTFICNPINILKHSASIPVLCVHGDKDTLISVENSISFVERLKELNNDARLIVIKGIDHEHAIDIARGPGDIHSKQMLEYIKTLE